MPCELSGCSPISTSTGAPLASSETRTGKRHSPCSGVQSGAGCSDFGMPGYWTRRGFASDPGNDGGAGSTNDAGTKSTVADRSPAAGAESCAKADGAESAASSDAAARMCLFVGMISMVSLLVRMFSGEPAPTQAQASVPATALRSMMHDPVNCHPERSLATERSAVHVLADHAATHRLVAAAVELDRPRIHPGIEVERQQPFRGDGPVVDSRRGEGPAAHRVPGQPLVAIDRAAIDQVGVLDLDVQRLTVLVEPDAHQQHPEISFGLPGGRGPLRVRHARITEIGRAS